jgi:TPP-dependent trihydroxycyclohexane-1,2-dione (THcHDO) dehydratase
MNDLNNEQQSCEGMRGKYQSKWTQEPSSKQTSRFHQTWNKHSSSLRAAAEIDKKVLMRFEQLQKFAKVFNLSEAKIAQEFSAQVRGSSKTENLLDADFSGLTGAGGFSERASVDKLEDLYRHLSALKSERGSLMTELKQKVFVTN